MHQKSSLHSTHHLLASFPAQSIHLGEWNYREPNRSTVFSWRKYIGINRLWVSQSNQSYRVWTSNGPWSYCALLRTLRFLKDSESSIDTLHCVDNTGICPTCLERHALATHDDRDNPLNASTQDDMYDYISSNDRIERVYDSTADASKIYRSWMPLRRRPSSMVRSSLKKADRYWSNARTSTRRELLFQVEGTDVSI